MPPKRKKPPTTDQSEPTKASKKSQLLEPFRPEKDPSFELPNSAKPLRLLRPLPYP
jgi:hypothetical protein